MVLALLLMLAVIRPEIARISCCVRHGANCFIPEQIQDDGAGLTYRHAFIAIIGFIPGAFGHDGV